MAAVLCDGCGVSWSASAGFRCWLCLEVVETPQRASKVPLTEEEQADALLNDLIEWNQKRKDRPEGRSNLSP